MDLKRRAFTSVPVDFTAVRGRHWSISLFFLRRRRSVYRLVVVLEAFVTGILGSI